jgi:hypothetical protein
MILYLSLLISVYIYLYINLSYFTTILFYPVSILIVTSPVHYVTLDVA